MEGDTDEQPPAQQQQSPKQQPDEKANNVAPTSPISGAVSLSRVNVVPNVTASNGSNNISSDVEAGVVGGRVEPAPPVPSPQLSIGQPAPHPENSNLRRKWEYFPGKNRFYCDGRVMTAPSIRFCTLSFALILLTFVLFVVFDAPFLTDKLSVAIPIVGSVLFVSVIVNMIKTSFSDPGILPRASQQEADHLEKSYCSTNFRPPPRTKDIIVNGQVIKSKYCFTCKMFRPPRASHCSVCDNCVDRFDHHCPFLGNCIGKRNYRSFYTFIVSLSFLAVFVLSASIAHLAMLSKERGNFLEALRDSPGSAVVIIISFFGMWTVIGLTGFHTYLIAVEQTTNEDIKGLFGRANAKNPFSHGNFCQNCCFVLCGPSQPSLIDPRGYATPEFIAALPRKNDPNGMLSPGKVQQQNAIINDRQQFGQQGHSGPVVGVNSSTNKIYSEHPVAPIQHQPLHISSSQSSSSEMNNGGIKPGFPSLPSIPPEEKILIKGQTRNGRAVSDFRQTIPESTPEEMQLSQEEVLISPSAASTVSLSTMSTSNMSSSNDYDTVTSPLGGVGRPGRVVTLGSSIAPPSLRMQQQHVRPNARNGNSTKRMFSSTSTDHLDGIVDPSDFDDDLDMPSLSNLNEIGAARRARNLRGFTNINANNDSQSSVNGNGLTKSTRSLPAASLPVTDSTDIHKIHVLDSNYQSSSKPSENNKGVNRGLVSTASGKLNKFGNNSGKLGNKRHLETSTMQNSPLHLDTIM